MRLNTIRSYLTAGWDAYRTAKQGQAVRDRRQQERLRDLVAYARTHSAYFADLYRDVPDVVANVAQLPVVAKAEMMLHFNLWVTDPSVTLAQVEAFVADPSLIGHDYLNRYVVCTTSGSTGTPAILLHDSRALVIYNVLGYVRAFPAAMFSACNLWALVLGKGRLAAVFVTGGHFLGNTMMARRLRTMPSRSRMQRVFSALSPLPELVAGLNAFQPVVLAGYPSALQSLAKEQQAGRLHIHPVLVNAAGETLTAAVRQHIEAAFHCPVRDYYGASEAVGLTFECHAQRLHVNSDWYIVEPVDEHDRAVPPGKLSHDVLVTNLANRVQPIIRYRLGDQVTIEPEPCSCGSPFPQIRVIGRTDDVLNFPTPEGETIRILPLAIAAVAEETPGIANCQLIQRGPLNLTVRFVVKRPEEEHAVWLALQDRLASFLSEHGATTVKIDRASEPPQRHPRTGKYRQVYSEVGVRGGDSARQTSHSGI